MQKTSIVPTSHVKKAKKPLEEIPQIFPEIMMKIQFQISLKFIAKFR